MKLRVTGDLVFVRPEAQPIMSDGGLHLVYDRQHSTIRGTVVAIGRGPVTTKGIQLDHCCAVGDRVIFSPDVGSEVRFERETLIAMREDDVLAVVES